MSILSASSSINSIPLNEHVMLLYNDDHERNNAAINYLNEGLKKGYHCIYASIDAYDSKSSSNISALSSKIDNYKENIENGDLQIVDFKSYYESALHLDLTPFKNLKKEMEKTLQNRKSQGKKDAILTFADAACFLSYNNHLAECEVLERWWHETTTEWIQTQQNITVVCPHPRCVLDNPSLLDTKYHLNRMHTITIDSSENIENKKKKKEKRILIVEPEPDIRCLYSLYTKYLDFLISDVKLVENGNSCLEYIFSNPNDNNDDYDIIILDTHLSDISAFEVAQKIRNRYPHKRIIFTTTNSLNNIRKIIDPMGIKDENVLLKPFDIYDFVSIINKPSSC